MAYLYRAEVGEWDWEILRNDLNDKTYDITWDGSNWWTTINNEDDSFIVKRHPTTYAVIASYSSHRRSRGLTYGNGLLHSTGFFERVYRYNLDGSLNTTFSIDPGGLTVIGITWDGSHFWVGEGSTKTINKYTTTFSKVSTFTAPYSGDPHTRGALIEWHLTDFFMFKNEAPPVIGKVTTSGVEQSTIAGPGARGMRGFHFRSDENMLYVISGPEAERGISFLRMTKRDAEERNPGPHQAPNVQSSIRNPGVGGGGVYI